MKIKSKLILKLLYFLSWVIFVGVSIEAGGFIVNAVGALVNPSAVKYLYHSFDLSALLKHNHGYYFTLTMLMSIVAIMRAILFYLIIDILHSKKLNISRPFSKGVDSFIQKIAYVTLAIGLFSWWGVKYTQWVAAQGVAMPDIQSLSLGGADVWLFMSVTLFVIAQIFKRGVEIQTENELTV